MLEFDNIRLELEGLEEPVNTLRESLHCANPSTSTT